MDYMNLPRHQILCVDMKSFFATCECVDRGYDPLKKKLAVVGNKQEDGSVVLAATPSLKKLGITTGSRLFEIKKMNDPSIVVVTARMGRYQEVSQDIRYIFEQFVPKSHIDVYSVDEAWLTLDGTEHLWGSAWQTAFRVQEEILKQTKIIATVGIGDNKLLAKVVLDNYGKNEGIAECRYEDVKTFLHPLPVEKMWGIGEQTRKSLAKMKIYTIGELAKANPETLKKTFGVNGLKLHQHANGIDLSPVIYENGEYTPSFANNNEYAKSVGRGTTLWQDYKKEEDILLVIRELLEEVCETLRHQQKAGKTLQLSIDYSKAENESGFSRQISLEDHTNDEDQWYVKAKQLFFEFYKKKKPVRKIRVSIGNLILKTTESEMTIREGKAKEKFMAIQDELNQKYGKGTIQRASSLQQKSVSKELHKKIRGHYE